MVSGCAGPRANYERAGLIGAGVFVTGATTTFAARAWIVGADEGAAAATASTGVLLMLGGLFTMMYALDGAIGSQNPGAAHNPHAPVRIPPRPPPQSAAPHLQRDIIMP